MKTFEDYRESILNAPSEVARERYRAEADHSGKFTAEQLDELFRLGSLET